MNRWLLALTLFGRSVIQAADVESTADEAKRKAILEHLQQMLPPSEPWEKWLHKTGELPPDFDRFPSQPFLPDALRFSNSQPVQNAAQWINRRQELLDLFSYFVLGTTPLPPGNVRAVEVQSRLEAGARQQAMVLEFGPDHKGRLSMELIVPPGPGPFPVFMTPETQRRWAMVAVSRGYLACVYAAADGRDDTTAFAALWPQHDWGGLARRSWAASRCLDYLCTLPNVDRARVAMVGHSREAKQALVAAAMDSRFSAVVSSSSGSGGVCTYRYFSEAQFGEGIELITRVFPGWLHPRLRFFAGRENRLPIDQHELIACLAPRPCLISTALNDPVESVWAVEQTYYAAQRVYGLLGAADALNLRYRSGSHDTRAEDVEAFLDWLDTKFGRRKIGAVSLPIYPTFADWLRNSGETIQPQQFPAGTWQDLLTSRGGNPILTREQWTAKRDEIKTRLQWGLGGAPSVAISSTGEFGAEPPYVAAMLGRVNLPKEIEKRTGSFGNYVAGDLYSPAGAAQGQAKIPAVIWVHPVSNSNGYVPGFSSGEPVHWIIARAGFAVFAFDQIGNGSRLEEAHLFYQRYPRWSLLGKMVQDIRSAVDALSAVPFVDPQRIYLLGYSSGGMASLHAAALDERIAGVVSVAGFTPMRSNAADKGTGGLARWSQWYPLQPRLSAFIGFETFVPYDYHEVLALIAPRPVMVVAPRWDYQVTQNDVVGCLTEVKQVYNLMGASSHLVFLELNDYNRFSPDLQQSVVQRLVALAGITPKAEPTPPSSTTPQAQPK